MSALEGRATPAGYRMIKSFDLKHFRCFEHVSLQGLSVIKVIVGDNGSAKTALGEALFLAVGAQPSTAIFVRSARNRAMPQQPIVWNREFFEGFWQDIFFRLDQTLPVEIEFNDSREGTYKIEISYPKESGPRSLLHPQVRPLQFKRTNPLGETTTMTATTDDKGNPVYEGGPREPIPRAYAVPSMVQFNPQDSVILFSDLSKSGKENVVKKALTMQFGGNINDLAILLDATIPTLYTSAPSIPDAKVPLAVVSSGIARYVNMLLGIASTPKGIVLVDEIENGIYYKRFPQMWKTLRDFCVKNETQLFASTHSWECLKSLLPAMKGRENDFSLIRLERAEKGNPIVRHFYGEQLEGALELDGEVR